MAIYKRGRRVEEGSTEKQIQLVRAEQSKSVGRVLILPFFFFFISYLCAVFILFSIEVQCFHIVIHSQIFDSSYIFLDSL